MKTQKDTPTRAEIVRRITLQEEALRRRRSPEQRREIRAELDRLFKMLAEVSG